MVQRQSLGAYLVRQLGWRGGARVSRLVMAWTLGEVVSRQRFDSAEDFFNSEWNQEAAEYRRATLYRDLGDFRQVFPDWDTPRQMIEATPALRRVVKQEHAARRDVSEAVFSVTWEVA
jgi:hypothetical protein